MSIAGSCVPTEEFVSLLPDPYPANGNGRSGIPDPGGPDCRRPGSYRRAVLKYRSARSGSTVAMLPGIRRASCRAAQTLAPEEMPTSSP